MRVPSRGPLNPACSITATVLCAGCN